MFPPEDVVPGPDGPPCLREQGQDTESPVVAVGLCGPQVFIRPGPRGAGGKLCTPASRRQLSFGEVGFVLAWKRLGNTLVESLVKLRFLPLGDGMGC